jgi:malate dehydrogenase (oxaloacetate-decarboxylating)(NADP+)
LLGNRQKIHEILEENYIELETCQIIDVAEQPNEKIEKFAQILYRKRQRKGMTLYDARKMILDRNYYGAMMVHTGEADALISGLTKEYARTIRPALQVIGVEQGVNRVAGMYIITNGRGESYFFADTTVNVNPTAEELVDIIGLAARKVRFFGVEPRMAVVSYSNFGSAYGEQPEKAALAVQKAKRKYPSLVIDGEVQANVALDTQLMQENYPFSELATEGANTLIFTELNSGNISYKLLQQIGGNEAIGPILIGMKKPVHVLQLGSSIREIVNMVAIAVVEAQG